jgi:hypothetical protein
MIHTERIHRKDLIVSPGDLKKYCRWRGKINPICLFYDNFHSCRNRLLYHFPRNKYAYGFLNHICLIHTERIHRKDLMVSPGDLQKYCRDQNS